MFEVLLSIIGVSIDGFFVGTALALKNTKISIKKLLIISIIPIIMAYPVMFLGYKVSSIISNNIIKFIGFILFFIMAIKSYIEIKKEKEVKELDILNSFTIGFTVGLDSSVCAFTLALLKYNIYITPIYFGLSHFVLILLGNYLFLKRSIKLKYLKYLSPIVFLCLAFFKLL